MTFPETLAALNAGFNATAATLLALAYRAIRNRAVERHRRLMLSACAVSVLFLASYTTRMAIAGDTPFTGQGPVRVFYFGLLISHVLLAMSLVPLVPITLYRGFRAAPARHRFIAKITLPIWFYVSVTGVLVYLMLYQY